MRSLHVVLFVGAILAGTLIGKVGLAEDLGLPEARGRAQVMESCMQCHGADVILARPRSAEEWSQTVSQMIGYGAILTDDQYQTVVAYLSDNLDPSKVGAKSSPSPTPQEPQTPHVH